MRARNLFRALLLSGAALVAACGGNTVAGDVVGDDDDTDSSSTGTPAVVTLLASSNQLTSDADTSAEGVTLTAIVKDSSNVVLSDVDVSFSATSGALIIASSTTDNSGQATATLTTGGISTLRTITVTVTVGSLTATQSIQVVNSVSTSPTAPAATNLVLFANATRLSSTADTLAEGVTLTVVVTNGNGITVSGAPVNFAIISGGGALGSVESTTDSSGSATAVLYTPGNSASRNITVAASVNNGTATLTDTIAIAVVSLTASIQLIASAPQLVSDAVAAADGVTITAIVRDSDNNLVEGVNLNFSSTGGALQTTQPAVTDSSGAATAVLTTGGDPSNRTVTVTAAGQSLSGSINVDVVGTRLSISGPDAIGSQQAASYTVNLTNGDGAPLSQRTVTVTRGNAGNTLSASTLTTNSSGQASFTLTGNVGGSETISASSLGANTLKTVTISAFDLSFTTPAANTEVDFGTAQTVTVVLRQNGVAQAGETIQFSTTRGTLSATLATTNASGAASVTVSSTGPGGAGLALITAVGPQSESLTDRVTTSRQIEFVATTPATIDLRAEPATLATGAQSTLRAVVRDANGNLVKNKQIEFKQIGVDPSGGSLTSASVVLTDSQGTASVTYVAGGTSSGDEDVRVDATLTDSGISDSTFLTVGGLALRITLGTGNTLSVEDDSTAYRMPFSAVITDSAGNPAPTSTVFRLKLLSVEYQKGYYVAIDTDDDGTPDTWVPNYTATVGSTESFGCANEDVNNNGILDLNEDVNGNGALDLDEDLDNDGNLDVREDLNNDGNLDLFDEDIDNDLNLDDVDEDVDGDGNLDVNEPDFDLDGVLDAGEDLDSDGNRDSAEDLDGDGYLDTGEDINHNGALDVGEDVNGDGLLDRNEDFDDDGVLDRVNEDVDSDGSLDYDEDIDNDGNLDAANEDADNDFILDAGEDADLDGRLDRGEDVNDNGTLDISQDVDINANGNLEPGNVGSVPSTVDLDEDGRAFFEIVYPKSNANWILVRLVAIASVAGTESQEDVTFTLPVLRADVKPSPTVSPPGTVGASGFVESPYGTASRCSDPN